MRDVASLAGNTMLVVRHIDGTDTPPFPSDMFTALCAMGASVDVLAPSWPQERRLPMLDFSEQWRHDDDLQRGGVILRYHIPFTREHEWARTYKVALREVNAHAIVNAGLRVRFADDATVAEASAVLGGIGPVAFHAAGLERLLIGRRWDGDTLAAALGQLRQDVLDQIEQQRTTDGRRARRRVHRRLPGAAGRELPLPVLRVGRRGHRPRQRRRAGAIGRRAVGPSGVDGQAEHPDVRRRVSGELPVRQGRGVPPGIRRGDRTRSTRRPPRTASTPRSSCRPRR